MTDPFCFIIALLCGFLALCVCRAEGVKFYTEKPDFIESCRIYEPEFTKCSTRSVHRFLQNVIRGNLPEIFETFGSIDPMTQDQLVFKQDNNDVATISANITDLVVRGFGEMIIKESKVSKKDFSWQTKIFLPKLSLHGKYKMEGRILLLPLNGAGNMSIEIDNVNVLMSTKTRLYEHGGFTFYNVTSVKADLNMTRVRTQMDNLFNGRSKEVERSTNQFFNDNWQDFFEALRPLVVETLERTLLKLLRELFTLVPANFFVSDIPTSLSLYGRKTNLISKPKGD